MTRQKPETIEKNQKSTIEQKSNCLKCKFIDETETNQDFDTKNQQFSKMSLNVNKMTPKC